jgi:hypothetical protein
MATETYTMYRVSIKSFSDYKQTVYLDMLELYVTPQLEEFQPWIIFQQDGAPPHWGSHVRATKGATKNMASFGY